MKLLLTILCLIACTGHVEAQGKKTYNVWSKEKVRYLKHKVIRDPYNVQLRLLLANAYHADGKNYEARDQLQEALELQPDSPEAHCNLAVILHSQGIMEDARKHYEVALELDSTMVGAKAGLGTLLCRLEKQAEGLEYLEQVVAADPKHSNARYNIAVAYHKIGDFRKAIEHLEALLATDADYPGARRALARAYYSLGLLRLQARQPDMALEVLCKAVEYEKSNENMLFAKGLAHMDRGEYPEAEVAFKEVVEMEMDHVPALHNLGVVYEQMGRLQDAAKYYDRVKKLTPHLSTIEAVKHATFDVNYLVK